MFSIIQASKSQREIREIECCTRRQIWKSPIWKQNRFVRRIAGEGKEIDKEAKKVDGKTKKPMKKLETIATDSNLLKYSEHRQ